jgi:hypothetical protein
MNMTNTKRSSRRRFFGQAGGVAALVAGAVKAASAAVTSRGPIETAVTVPPGIENKRLAAAFNMRVAAATNDLLVPPAKNVNNGDDARYPDKGGTFTKGLPHDNFGRVDQAAYRSLKTALASGKFSDFENIVMGGTRTLNGPQGGLAFDWKASITRSLECP